MGSSLRILDLEQTLGNVWALGSNSSHPAAPTMCLSCFNMVTLSLPLACSSFSGHFLIVSSVPGTVQALSGETFYLPTEPENYRFRVLSYQKSESTVPF